MVVIASSTRPADPRHGKKLGEGLDADLLGAADEVHLDFEDVRAARFDGLRELAAFARRDRGRRSGQGVQP